jgi:hypothetical protein
VIRAASPSEIAFICAKLPIPYSQAMRGVRNAGAMVIYDGWTPNSVQCHIFSSGPRFILDKVFVREVFTYPFIQCDKGILYTVTPESSRESLSLSKALGFREVFRQKDGWEVGVDMVVKEMRRNDCRYLRMH